MIKRPFFLSLMALLHLFIPLSLYLQVMFLYDFSFWDAGLILQKLTWMNLMIAASSLLCAYLYARASKRVFYFLVINIFLVAWNNYIVGSFGVDFSLTQSTLASLAYTVSHGLLLYPSIVRVFRDQSQRWWLSDRRFAMELPLILSFKDKNYQLQTHNISRSGIFMKDSSDASVEDHELLERSLIKEIELQQDLQIKLPLFKCWALRCQARIVRINIKKGAYPVGAGLSFQFNFFQRGLLGLALRLKRMVSIF